MSERTTKGMVVRAFQIFTKEAKINTSAKWLPRKRQYSRRYLTLDYNPAYGGYRMDWVKKNTGETFFMQSATRRSNKEMYAYLWGLINRARFNKRRG